MNDIPMVERLRGARIRTGANRPFTMEDRKSVAYVEDGHLDMFVVESRDGLIVGRRRHVARFRRGEMAFGTKPLEVPGRPGHSLGFLAVPSQGAVVVMGQRAGVGAADFDLATTDWVDRWIARLSEFLVSELPRPREAVLIEADPDVPHTAGSILSAQHRDVVWVSSDAPMRFLGRDDVVCATGEPLLPVSEHTWFEVDRDCKVSALYTPTALLRDELWPAFDHFGVRVLELALLMEREHVHATRGRRSEVFRARVGSLTGSLEDFERVLAPKGRTGPTARVGRTPMAQAAHLVAEATGVALEASAVRPRDAGGKQELEVLARRSRLRTRRIRLLPRWWKRDGPSMVGFRDDDGRRPVALLSDDRGGYSAVDPASGTKIAVNGAEARGFASHAFRFYAPLPDHSGRRRLLDVLRFAAHGRAADFRTVVGMGILTGLAALMTPILTGHILVHIIPRGDTSLWVTTFAALLMVTLGSIVFDVVRGIAALRIESRMDERLQAALWSHLMSLPAPFFRRFAAGDLTDRAGGLASVRQTILGAAVPIAMGVIVSVFSLALLFHYSGLLALLVTVLLLGVAMANWLLSLMQLRHYRKVLDTQGELRGLLLQMIMGLAKLRVANAENFVLSRWADLYRTRVRETLSAQYWGVGAAVLDSMFQPITYIVIFATATQALSAEGGFNLVAFLSFNAAFGQLAASIAAVTAGVTSVIGVIPAIERARPILDADREFPGGIDPGHLKGDLEFDGVSFRYEPDAPKAVDDVSFRIRPGDYVALAGPSGCGKSTIFRLLLGFEMPESGTVFVDGHNLNSLDASAIRGRMGVVQQGGRILAGTIYENIAGMAVMSDREVWDAAHAAALDEDIRAMPMGMRTVLSEGGTGISVGQRQRLLIARAVACKPRVMLLDEATSALDNRAQAKVQRSLAKLGVTRLVIAHRLSSIRDAERILVMDKGRIVERGTYRQLVEQGGLFAELVRRQVAEE